MKLKKLFEKLFYLLADFSPFLGKSEYKVGNHRIIINQTDSDTWPSYPHAHIIGDSIKLNIYTGGLYRIQTKLEINRASDKDMKKLWNDKSMLKKIRPLTT